MDEAFDAGGDAPPLVFACWFWFFAVFWSTAWDGQHQNPSGVTAMGTFLIFVVRASRLAVAAFNSAMFLRKLNIGIPLISVVIPSTKAGVLHIPEQQRAGVKLTKLKLQF